MHFDCIGFSFSTEGVMQEEMARIYNSAQPIARRDGGRALIWNDESGARIVIMEGRLGDIECVTPSFAGESKLAISVSNYDSNDECRFCQVARSWIRKGDISFPIPLQFDTIVLIKNHIPRSEPITASITGFAEEFKVWETAADFQEDPSTIISDVVPAGSSGPLRWGVGSFAPAGGLEPDNERTTAHAFMVGTVMETEVRVNSETSRRFEWALLETYAGQFDIVAPLVDARPALQIGNVVMGTCWLVGQVTDGLLKRPKGLLSRLRGA
jgi:hypothetical protein